MSKESNSETGAQDAATSEDAQSKSSSADIYDNRGPKKIIRVVTVIAYMFSVSFVGILLSAYYLFLWEPPNPKLITQRERLRAEPQMQLLIAEPFSDDADAKEREDPFRGANRTYKSFQGRIAHDDGNDPDEIDLATSRQGGMKALLLQLRTTLVEVLRARNRSSSRETVSNGSDSLLVIVGADKVLNSMEKMVDSADNSIQTTADGNLDLRSKFAIFSNAATVERSTASIAKSTSVSAIESHESFDGKSVPDDRPSVPIVERGNKKYEKSSEQTSEQYLIRGFNDARMKNDAASDGNQRALEDDDSHVAIEKFPRLSRLDILHDKEESTMRTIATSEVSRSNRSLPTNAVITSSMRDYPENDERFARDRTGRIARDRVSIDSPRTLGFTDDPKFHRPPDDTIVKHTPYTARNPEGERIPANPISPASPIPRRGINTAANRARTIIQ